jgi:hypothetical protein
MAFKSVLGLVIPITLYESPQRFEILSEQPPIKSILHFFIWEILSFL